MDKPTGYGKLKLRRKVRRLLNRSKQGERNEEIYPGAMSVYVDNMEAPFRNMIMCHMIADTTVELFFMCDKIGVQRKWIQQVGTAREHFDICLAKKRKALVYGAIEIELRSLAAMTKRREIEGRLGNPDEAEEWLRSYYEWLRS